MLKLVAGREWGAVRCDLPWCDSHQDAYIKDDEGFVFCSEECKEQFREAMNDKAKKPYRSRDEYELNS